MTVRDRVRGWMDRWSAAQADRMLLRWAPPIRRDVAKLRWAYEHGTDRGRNAYQGHLNRWSMAMGRPAPDPVGAALHGVDPAATLRLALQLGAVPTNAAMGLEAGLPQPARRSYEFPAFAGIGGRHPGLRQLPKPTPWNIRRFSEAPPPRRAVNKIKHAILRLPWSWEPRDEALLATSAGGRKGTPPPEMQGRIDALTRAMRYPNDTDTWRTVLGQLIEDILVGAFGTLETQEWDNELQPVRMWPVDGMTVRVNIDYAGDDAPDPMQRYRYSQTLAYGGAGMTAPLSLRKFLDRELLYIRYDPRTATPFGLAPTEVAFNMINAWLGVMDARERMESNEVPPFGLDLGEDISREDLMAFRFYWENDIEGMGKIPLLGGHKAPSVLMMRQPARGVALNAWPDLVLRMIAISYHLAPQTFGMERDVNRNTSEVMQSEEFADAVVPVIGLLEDAFTQHFAWKLCGWDDLKFTFNVTAGDPQQQATVANLLYNGDIITLNEAREKAGEDSLPIEDPRGEVFKTEYVAQIQAQYHVAVPFGGGGGGSQQQAQDPNAPGAYGQPTQDQLMQQQQQLADPYGNPYMRLLEELEAPPVQTQIPAPVPQPVVMMQPTGVTVDPVTGTVQWLTSEAQRALAAVAVVAASRATPDGQPVPVPDAQVLEQVRGALARVRGERAA